jgi:predicted DNA-binding protein (UPF0251 family)
MLIIGRGASVPRPRCRRFVETSPVSAVFKPAGVPLRDLPAVEMTVDELEALRLADLEGLYQEDAAARMGVSRPTLGRILESARRKVAEALVLGRALRIEGGPVVARLRRGHCPRCAHRWGGGGPSAGCPRCGSAPAP